MKKPKVVERHQTPTVRQMKLVELVSKGVPTKRALVESGYSPKVAAQSGMSKRTRVMVNQARLRFVDQYMSESVQRKFDGKFTARRLHHIASLNKSERDRFNAVAAIKEHHRVIMQTEKSESPIHNHLTFIIPMQAEAIGWNGKSGAIDAETVQPGHNPDTKSDSTDDTTTV